jgi:hypothetical protein
MLTSLHLPDELVRVYHLDGANLRESSNLLLVGCPAYDRKVVLQLPFATRPDIGAVTPAA